MDDSYTRAFVAKTRPQHKFATSWCDFFVFMLKQRRLNQSTFADLVGEKPPVINQYATGRSKPPLNSLDRWADALRMNTTDRWRFHWLALEAYTPRAVWDRIVEMEASLASLEQTRVELAGKLLELNRKLGGTAEKAV